MSFTLEDFLLKNNKWSAVIFRITEIGLIIFGKSSTHMFYYTIQTNESGTDIK